MISFWKLSLLGVLGPGILSGQAGDAGCHATLPETRRQVSWAGNAGEMQFSADQLDCPASASLPWISVSVNPPVTGDATQRVLRYSVDTNFSTAKRQGAIQVGGSTLTLEQAGGPAPGMAFSPGRLEFTFTPGKDAPTEATKTLFVGSEEPLAFTAKPAEETPWIKIKDNSGTAAQNQHSFLVTVSAAGKRPGVYRAAIQIEAPGAANSKELVPVTMTVEEAK